MILDTDSLTSSLNLESAQLTLNINDISTLTLSILGEPPSWMQYRASLTLTRQNATIFVGFVTKIKQALRGNGQLVSTVEFSDFLWLGTQENYIRRVANQSTARGGTDGAIRVGELLSNLPGIAFDVSRLANRYIFVSVKGLTSSLGVMQRALQNLPDSLAVANYSTQKMQLMHRDDAGTFTLDADRHQIADISLTPRHDAAISQVRSIYTLNDQTDRSGAEKQRTRFYPSQPMDNGGGIKTFCISVSSTDKIETPFLKEYFEAASTLQIDGSITLHASKLDSLPLGKSLQLTGSKIPASWAAHTSTVRSISLDLLTQWATFTLGLRNLGNYSPVATQSGGDGLPAEEAAAEESPNPGDAGDGIRYATTSGQAPPIGSPEEEAELYANGKKYHLWPSTMQPKQLDDLMDVQAPRFAIRYNGNIQPSADIEIQDACTPQKLTFSLNYSATDHTLYLDITNSADQC